MAGIPKSARLAIAVRVNADNRAGRRSGRVTVRRTVITDAPDTRAASSKSGEMERKLEEMMTYAVGKEWIVISAMTPSAP